MVKMFPSQLGLLQGHPLSPGLCDVYCGHLVRNYLPEFLSNNNKSILCRGMDDFIFATPDKILAEK